MDSQIVKGISNINQVTSKQIALLKQRCSSVLERPFTRRTFYMDKNFLDGYSSNPKLNYLDPFQ